MSKITDITRNNIIDILIFGFEDYESIRKYDYYEREYYEEVPVHIFMNMFGKLEELKFIERVFDLKKIPSTDSRFESALGDIWQHRVNNDDWEDYWFFDYEVFDLRNGSDEIFLKFLIEIFHPAVRREDTSWERYLFKFNELLKYDGFEIYKLKKISGRDVYSYRRIATDETHIVEHIEVLSDVFDSNYIETQMQEMIKSIESNPSDAIGKSKELLESCCKTILDNIGSEIDKEWSVQRLMKETCKKLKLTTDDIDPEGKAARTTKQILGNLSSISGGLAELRNSYGSGHGKEASYKGLSERHARLAVNSSLAAVRFLWDTFSEGTLDL